MKGILEDDLPFSLGEKAGMTKTLTYILPRGYKIPSHQTVRRDLDRLELKMNEKVNMILQVVPSELYLCLFQVSLICFQENSSQIGFSSDVWTSKNSVYAFVGSVAFWIDDNWDLHACPIELLPLDGNHSGKATGRALFKALQARKVTHKLSMYKHEHAVPFHSHDPHSCSCYR